MQKALSTDSYHLILGMPGTGKTHLITQMILHLMAQNKKVLLTTFTNQALDNILLKLAEHSALDQKVVRIQSSLGSSRVAKYSFRREDFDSVKAMEERLGQARLFCVTNASLNNLVISLECRGCTESLCTRRPHG